MPEILDNIDNDGYSIIMNICECNCELVMEIIKTGHGAIEHVNKKDGLTAFTVGYFHSKKVGMAILDTGKVNLDVIDFNGHDVLGSVLDRACGADEIVLRLIKMCKVTPEHVELAKKSRLRPETIAVIENMFQVIP